MAKSCLYFSELELYFGSAAEAAAATESLYKLREGIEVDYGQPLPVVENSTAGKYRACIYIGLGGMLCHKACVGEAL